LIVLGLRVPKFWIEFDFKIQAFFKLLF